MVEREYAAREEKADDPGAKKFLLRMIDLLAFIGAYMESWGQSQSFFLPLSEGFCKTLGEVT